MLLLTHHNKAVIVELSKEEALTSWIHGTLTDEEKCEQMARIPVNRDATANNAAKNSFLNLQSRKSSTEEENKESMQGEHREDSNGLSGSTSDKKDSIGDNISYNSS